MRLLSRRVFRDILTSSFLGVVLFTFMLFLERASPLFEFLVRNSGPPRTVAYLFALVLPQALPLAIPLGVLIGTLITMSRMSTDGEITAMRAGGVSGRRLAPPILTFGFMAMCIAAASSLWLTPWSIRERYRIQNQLVATQLTADVQPRVFAEQFPDHILYIGDVIPGSTARWRRIFIADLTPPEKRPAGTPERSESPRVTLASEALAVGDVAQNRVQLTMRNGSTYEAEKDPTDYRVTDFAKGDQLLEAQRPGEVAPSRTVSEMDTGPLYRAAYRNPGADKNQLLDARVELHQRLALPFACILLALTGFPLGVTTRRAGKSSAFVLTFALAFIYYMGLISLIRLALQGTLPAGLAVWLPNIVFATLGLGMLIRLEAPGDRDIIGRIAAFFRALSRPTNAHVPPLLDRLALAGEAPGSIFKRSVVRFPLLIQVVDVYVLATFLFYFVLLLATFVLMYHVFTFFELLSDIIKNHVAMSRVLQYHLFLTPRLVYRFTPYGVLTAVLVVFGVLSKHNEVTAFKACGVSVYRLAFPVFVASLLLSGGLFAFDHYWVPDADRQQDAIYAEIKGRPAQTFLHPERKWISGLRDRVFYYKYFDLSESAMAGVSVYEIDPVAFRLKRHISADSARWEPALNVWVFRNGWSWTRDEKDRLHFDNFANQARTFPEIEETPDYFMKEVRQPFQMNFQELRAYIDSLKLSGFDTVALEVQYHKKFAVPLFALIMALVSAPFAFIAGNRGAMAGVGLSLAIAIAYWSVDQVFQQVGNLGQLPAAVAAWSPNAVFSLAGLFFLARLRS
jgi:LPS export ABC transporter permease LptF/LPS export ABC transporter permease LptG